MSEWGRVALYYDYVKEDKWMGEKRVRGLVSKAYKYPDVLGMILHAYYGTMHFLAKKDDEYDSLDGENCVSDISGWAELNTAFDVFWDYQVICNGSDSVRGILSEGDQVAPKDWNNYLFNCEGSDGWLFIKYTGNPQDGYSLKYGYFYGYGDLDRAEVGDLRRAMEICCKHRKQSVEERFGPDFDEVLTFFDENASLMDEEEFWGIEDLGIAWIKEMVSMDE